MYIPLHEPVPLSSLERWDKHRTAHWLHALRMRCESDVNIDAKTLTMIQRGCMPVSDLSSAPVRAQKLQE